MMMMVVEGAGGEVVQVSDEVAEPERSPAAARGGEGLVPELGELWRIEGSLTAVRAEVDQLATLDDGSLRTRLVELELRWRGELDAILPPSLSDELHALFDWAGVPDASASEVRLGLAQLEGWLDGVIAGAGYVVVQPSSQ